MVLLTTRVPAALDRRLRAAARRRGASKSDLVRQAVTKFLEQDQPAVEEPSVLDLIGDLVGSVRGPGDLAGNPAYMSEFGR
jgi:Arc/MetJ-type ribon-helix-helix transcriptional regulator